MAGKEATVYIVDVGASMGNKRYGRDKKDLDWALEYVWDKITATVQTGRKTAMAALVALRSDDTDNPMDSEESYQNIKVLQGLGQVLMPDVRRLRNELVVSDTHAGDAISSLVVAVQMIAETCKKLKYDRKIVLVTDARASMETDDLPQIKKKIQEDGIDLFIVGVDFDDPEYGFKEESKDQLKLDNEEIFRQFCEDCNGTFGTLAQAVEAMQVPRTKSTRPVPSYKGFLTLGNPELFEDALTIDVERYPKTMVAKAPTASKFVVRHGVAEATQSSATLSNGDNAPADEGDGLANIVTARTYQVDDENAPGGKKDVKREELSKGYEYGRTAVHISESDQNVTAFESKQGLDIIGFVTKAQYQRYLDLSRSNMIVSQKHNDKASMALSSFIHALYELDSYAVARLVPKDMKDPKVIILAPNIEPDFECLYGIELPFAEDLRSYKFPPLDRVVTVSGKVLKVHRNLPADELQDAMSDYVDSMDLSTFGKDDEGEDAEYAQFDETFSPMLHRLNQVIKHRAVYPEAQIPGPYDILIKYSHPPEDLVEKARPALDRVIKAGEVKKVPAKARGKRYSRKEAPKPLSDLDVTALLAQDPNRKNKRIDPKNAVPEFKQILENAEDEEQLADACKQLKNIVYDWIKHSVGDSNYGRAVEAIRVMREGMIELEFPGPYNAFLKELKEKTLGDDLGGERREMWYRVRVNRMKPILKGECEASEVTEEDAKQWMSMQLV
ncbi:ATP-dependent DNA helicase II subunit 2 [Fulvia fulva]|nr:ATP-dependent DNA helicase II subunit 2 [Fulvia fulva]WPV23302.1 ATP-dependent DNA helicase II subunit 2 [Fulvia fulva]